MNLRLRLLLYYLNNFKTKIDLSRTSAQKMRQINEEERERLSAIIDEGPCQMAKTEDLSLQVRDGAAIPYRYYEPLKREGKGAIVYYHGGGFVTRSIESHDKVCRRLAAVNRMPVFSIEYRLAPEYKFPIPVEDSYDAFNHIAENVQTWGIDPNRLIVMGDSAGGNLATVVSILAREAGGQTPWLQVLVYPCTDARLGHPSVDSLGEGYLLTKNLMKWFLDEYKRTDADLLDPLMSPLLHPDLKGLPSTFLCTADLDPLRDEGLAYAAALQNAGVHAIGKNYLATVHGFLSIRRICPKVNETLHQDIRQFILAQRKLVES